MNKGKAKCEQLKAIRRELAKANNIDYNPTECTFQGDCDGTCPKCDAELEELNNLLKQKEANGEEVFWPTVDMEEYSPNINEEISEEQDDQDDLEDDQDDLELDEITEPPFDEEFTCGGLEPLGGDILSDDEELDSDPNDIVFSHGFRLSGDIRINDKKWSWRKYPKGDGDIWDEEDEEEEENDGDIDEE